MLASQDDYLGRATCFRPREQPVTRKDARAERRMGPDTARRCRRAHGISPCPPPCDAPRGPSASAIASDSPASAGSASCWSPSSVPPFLADHLYAPIDRGTYSSTALRASQHAGYASLSARSGFASAFSTPPRSARRLSAFQPVV